MESPESYCPACRYRLKPDSRYCSGCGHHVAPGPRRVRFQPWMAAPAVYLSGDRSVLRKLDEAILAVEIEHQYSKAQILEAYLNRIYYGNRAYGVEAAAETYFGKAARQLSLSEAALLAGLPQAPTALDPFSNLDGARARQRVVLEAMVKVGEITAVQAEAASAQKLTLQKPSTADDVKAPGFVHWVAAQLEKTYGEELLKNGGLTVVTSLDWNLQSIAERQVREKVTAIDWRFQS